MAPTDEPFQRDLILSVRRKYDLDIHVSRIVVDEVPYVDVREFVPSLSQYGRGLLIPADSVADIARAMVEAGG